MLFEELYIESYDKPQTQTAILKSLLLQKEEASYQLVLSLLEKDFPLDSKGTNRLFKTGKDNLSLKKELFPELLKYSSIEEYKSPIYSLLTELRDSSFIKPKTYKKYKNQLLNDAKIEIKRNLGKSSSYSYKSSNALDNYVKLLFPFRKDKKVQDFFDKLIKTESQKALTTYLALLAENGEMISPTLIEKTIYDEEALAATLIKLSDKNLLGMVPDSLKTQQHYARARLLNRVSFDKEKDAISFVKFESIENKDGKITIYFFKVNKVTRYSNNTKLYHIAFLEKPTLNTEVYMISKNAGISRIYGDEIEDELFEKAVELVKYKKRKRISGYR